MLLASETAGTTVDLVIQLAAHTIPATAGAGVTLVQDDGQPSVSASHAVVEQADALQHELGEGPCLSGWRDRVTVRVDDVAERPAGRPGRRRRPASASGRCSACRWSPAAAPSGPSRSTPTDDRPATPMLRAADDQTTFVMLATAPQRSNLQLSEVARQLVESVAHENVTRPTGDVADLVASTSGRPPATGSRFAFAGSAG